MQNYLSCADTVILTLQVPEVVLLVSQEPTEKTLMIFMD
ncbi:hypothetical protein XaFJ1_GM001065 [Xanthomonas albilineans]|nr:hypothetical protein XaFJ1_GM001065 [Xanthomonas albilineans]